MIHLLQLPLPTDPSYWWEPYGPPDHFTALSFVIGVLTLLAAGVIAWRQFVIMRRQTEMMKTQTALATEQTESSRRQEVLAVRLSEITETQHKILLDQAAKRTDLRVLVQGIDTKTDHVGNVSFTVRLHRRPPRFE